MTDTETCCEKTKVAAWTVALLGSLLVFGALAWLVIQKSLPPGVDVARAELRRKNLAELRAAEKLATETYGWIDQNKGIVRLPVDRAMELSVSLWREPAAGRSNLLARLEKATAKAPEKPNVYE